MPRSKAEMKLALACAVWVAMALAVVALARGLPPDTFFVGDPGVKLVVARHAIAHPSRPLELPLPVIGGKGVPYVDPFFMIHGGHAHAITSELFPLVSAPFIAWLGLRGAYVLPAIGFLMAILSCAWLGAALDDRRSPATIMLVAALATPFLFYGLEFWEHAPAVGIAALATVLFVKHPAKLAFPSGVLLGVAALLRPEALWWAVAVLAGSRLLATPPRLTTLLVTAGGFLTAGLPIAAYALVHFGTIVTPHAAVVLSDNWVPGSLAIRWFIEMSPINFWRVAPAVLLVLVPLPQPIERRGRSFLRFVALLDVALVILTAPNDGGGQWGPRYLLFAYLPLTILTADALQAIAHSRLAGTVAVVVVFAGSAWIQRTAYKELRGAKLTYGRVLDLVRSEVPAGGFAVTDLWWLDQVTAAATADRQFLYAPDANTAASVMKQLDAAGALTITTIRRTSDWGGSGSAEAAAWTGSTCYVEEGRREILEPGLLAVRLRYTCGTPVRPAPAALLKPASTDHDARERHSEGKPGLL